MEKYHSLAELQEIGVSFSRISENDAGVIIQTEFPLSKLLRYAVFFDRYRSTEKKGIYLNLDFAFLYELALLDAELRKVILCLCLDAEQSLKTVFFNDSARVNYQNNVVQDFIESDQDYILDSYNPQNLDTYAKQVLMETTLENLPLDEFLEIIRFGTFQRLSVFFYQKYARIIYGRDQSPYVPFMDSVRVLRNAAAHNNTILDGLVQTCSSDFHANYSVLSFLGQRGIKSRTLKTNMSKQPVHDFVCLIHLVTKIEPTSNTRNQLELIRSFLENRCTLHSEYFTKNPTLLSAYRFISQVLKVYMKV